MNCNSENNQKDKKVMVNLVGKDSSNPRKTDSTQIEQASQRGDEQRERQRYPQNNNADSSRPVASTTAVDQMSNVYQNVNGYCYPGNYSYMCPEDYSTYGNYGGMNNTLSLKEMEHQKNIKDAYEKKEVLNAQQRRHHVEKKFDEEVIGEAIEEHRKGKYEDVFCAADGTIECVTRGTYKDTEKRNIVNFKYPKLVRLKSTSGEDGYYELSLEIGGKPKRIFLDANKCDTGKYLLKKLLNAGAVFKSNKRAMQIDQTERIWALLLMKQSEPKTVAANIGWVKLGEHQYRFVEEGELIWDQVKKSAL